MSSKPYILGSVVARGGMAEVYRGLHVGQDGFKRLVAIKRILPHHAQNAEFAEMFKDEAHIGQRLQHANVVKVEGFDIIQGSPSIIMEFVDGSDLRSVLSATENRKQPAGQRSFIPSELCVYIIAEAARGLHYAHTRRDDVTGKPLNIVHRDMSPQNLLISWEGEVKVTDFGIAAADRDFKQTETKAGIVKGKYSYMSPEQISGKKVDPRTDVFALSVVLWEMLAMRRLFTADNEIDVIDMVRNCKIPVRLSEVNASVSEELEMIVMQGLAKDPRRRFETMESFEKTLRAWLARSKVMVTANELSLFVKDVLADRREAAQEEMRKILTADHSATTSSKTNSQPHQPIELNLEAAQQAPATLTVGRARAPGAPQPPPSLTSNQPSIIATRPPSSQYYSATVRREDAGSRGRHVTANRTANSKLSALWLVVASVAAIGGVFFFKSYRNAAKQSLTLIVRANPSPIRIKVNEREAAGGRFVGSPAKIRLEPGLNSIEISRPGYKSEKLLVDTDDGAPKITPSVRLRPAAVFAPVRFEYRGTENLTVTVGEGYVRQQVSAKVNVFQVSDFVTGVPLELVASNADKQIILRCAFTPSGSTKRRPLIVIIDAAKRGCETSGGNEGSP